MLKTDKTGTKTNRIRDIYNLCIFGIMFLFYALTFMVPKFYGLTEDYVGVFVFALLGLLFLGNVNPIKAIKDKDIDFIITAVVVIMTAVNLVIVNSGFGAFFVAADFAVIFYLSDKLSFKKWQVYTIGGFYLALMLYWFFYAYGWMFADYATYAMNTNTAATFTIFSLLCLIVVCELLYKKHEAFGILLVIILIKGIQLSLYHRARGAFIMLIVYMLLRFAVPKKWFASKKFFAALMFFATLGSLAFVAFYVLLGTTGVNFRLPFFYKNMFSGREAIWLEFWNLFIHKPLTGIGTNVTITSFFEFNVHNALYDILVIHGIVVFVGTLWLIYRRMQKAYGNMRRGALPFAAVCAIIAVFIESFFDVDLIWANYSMNLLFLLSCAFYKSEAADKNL